MGQRSLKPSRKKYSKKLIAAVAAGMVILLLSLLVFINGFNMPFLFPWKNDKTEPVQEITRPINLDKPSDLEIEKLIDTIENLEKKLAKLEAKNIQSAPNQSSVPNTTQVTPIPVPVPTIPKTTIENIPVPKATIQSLPAIPKPPAAPQAPDIKLPQLPVQPKPPVQIPLPVPVPAPLPEPEPLPELIPVPAVPEVPTVPVPKTPTEIIPKTEPDNQLPESAPKIDIKIEIPGKVEKDISVGPGNK